jgi:hypothetical protein
MLVLTPYCTRSLANWTRWPTINSFDIELRNAVADGAPSKDSYTNNTRGARLF